MVPAQQQLGEVRDQGHEKDMRGTLPHVGTQVTGVRSVLVWAELLSFSVKCVVLFVVCKGPRMLTCVHLPAPRHRVFALRPALQRGRLHGPRCV